MPSRSGSIRSSSTRSNGCASRSSSAAAPDSVEVTVYPCALRNRRSVRDVVTLSSTTSRCAGAELLATQPDHPGEAVEQLAAIAAGAADIDEQKHFAASGIVGVKQLEA